VGGFQGARKITEGEGDDAIRAKQRCEVGEDWVTSGLALGSEVHKAVAIIDELFYGRGLVLEEGGEGRG